MSALREDLEKQGAWLFKWRSYLPLLIIPLFVIALRNSGFVERLFGDVIGDFWESIAVMVSFLGLAIRCFTAGYVPRGTSGRNTQSQVADTLNTTGMYSVSRNPLYLANFVIILGVTLFIQVWWLALIVWIGFWLYYERIIFTEEEFSTYFAIVSVYFFLEIAETLLVEKRFFVHSSWLIFFLVSMGIYFILLILKKKTHILDVTGR